MIARPVLLLSTHLLLLCAPAALAQATLEAAASRTPARLQATNDLPRAIRRDVPLTKAIRRAFDAGTRDTTGRPGPRYWQLRTDFTIHARLDRATKTIFGQQAIVVHNNSPQALRRLVLRLDHNIFRPRAQRGPSVPAELTEGMVVTRIVIDGEVVDLESRRRVRGLDQTVATVTLKTPIASGAQAKVEIDWHTRLPGGSTGRGHRMTQRFGDTLFQPTQWFPRLAKFDDLHGWDTSPYLGPAEFYNNFGRFDVHLDVPAGWIVTATGELRNPEQVLTATARQRLAQVLESDAVVTIVGPDEVGPGKSTAAGTATGTAPGAATGTAARTATGTATGTAARTATGTATGTAAGTATGTAAGTATGTATGTAGDRLVWHFVADMVNDFAWATAENYVWKATRATIPQKGPIPIHMVFLPDRARRFARAGAVTRHALEFYSALWTPYPFPQLTLQDGPSAGMEYPMVINSNQGAADHETAHQWWPMMVGTNETRYGWMDEGFNTYMNILSRAHRQGKRANLDGRGRSYGQLSGDESEPPMMWIANYAGDRYGFQTYVKAPMMLSMLGGIVGDEAVQRAMRGYAVAWAFKHPSPWDFVFFMNNALERDLGWFWYYWLWTTESVEGSIAGVRGTGSETVVEVRQDGQMPSPVVLKVEFQKDGPALEPMPNAQLRADGSALVTWPVDVWFNGRRTFDARLQFGPRRIERITLDPAGRFPDADKQDNIWPR